MNVSPVFTHDCTRCRFLGTLVFEDGPTDLYVCDNTSKSRIARFGNNGPDYVSAPEGHFSGILALRIANEMADYPK